MTQAKNAICDHIIAENQLLTCYDSTHNPQDLPRSYFIEGARDAHNDMLTALALLNDNEAAFVLADNPDQDFDAEPFQVARLDQVRTRRAELAHAAGPT